MNDLCISFSKVVVAGTLLSDKDNDRLKTLKDVLC